MLLGAQIVIFTDHKNLTDASTVNQCMIRQLNSLEEYLPTYHHIPGENNVTTDSFGHLPHRENINYPLKEEKEQLYNVNLTSFCTSILEDNELIHCFLNLPDLNYEPFPLDSECIVQGQQADQLLLQEHMNHPLLYLSQYFNGLGMILYCVKPTTPWQICILVTNQLLQLVSWFHEVLGHCGIHHLCDSIMTHFCCPQLRATVNDVIKHCRAHQIKKLTGPGYGHLPPCEATALPFQEVAVDLIGPWHVTLPDEVYEFYAMLLLASI
jgi:hypothetical protein